MNKNPKNEPLVSICCITYNHEKYIRKCIEGFLMQKTSFPVEIIIHDDASTDSTPPIIHEYEKKYPDIFHPIFQRENQFSKGKKIFVNYVLPRARGKYIALCEGDDYWTDPLKLQKQVDFLEANPEYVMCIHESLDVWEDGRSELHNRIPYETSFTIKDLAYKNFVSTSSCVHRNHLINNYPDWFTNLSAGDWALHFLNAKFGDIYYMKDCMSVYRIHANGIWSRLSNDQMVVQGIKVMMIIDEGTNYEYHAEFKEGITQRIKKGNEIEINKIISDDNSLKKNLTKYV